MAYQVTLEARRREKLKLNKDEIDQYYRDNVEIDNAEKKSNKEKVLRVIGKVLERVNKIDGRFSKTWGAQGSSFQGLKDEKADEFDFNVPLQYIGRTYNVGQSSCSQPYGPSRPIEDPAVTLPDDVTIQSTFNYGVPAPPKGYAYFSMANRNSGSQYWNDSDEFHGYDLVPFLIKRRLKKVMIQAVMELEREGILQKDELKRQAKAHGPALTYTMTVPALTYSISAANGMKIDIDFSLMVMTRTSFDPNMWPRPNRMWPDAVTRNRIRDQGIQLVPKRNLVWLKSYAESEKILLKRIDSDGGQRKKTQRIFKKMNKDYFCPTTKPVISSYVLKNLLFWECDRLQDSSDWTDAKKPDRLLDLTKRLFLAVKCRELYSYFDITINLFEGKELDQMQLAQNNIKKFLQHQGIIPESFFD